MSFEDFYPKVEAMVETIAWEYGGKGRHHGMDGDDFRQEFIAWLLDHKAKVSDLYEYSDTAEDFERADRFVAKCLRNEGNAILARMNGHEDKYNYTPEQVKALLPFVLDPESFGGAAGEETATYLTDVTAAFKRLPQDDKETLAAFHLDRWTNKMMAESRGISEASMSYYHTRAIKRLVKLLGSPVTPEYDPWHGRRAVSSEAARSYQARSYE